MLPEYTSQELYPPWLPTQRNDIPPCPVHHSWRCTCHQQSFCSCKDDMTPAMQPRCSCSRQQEPRSCEKHSAARHQTTHRHDCPCPLRRIISCKWKDDPSKVAMHLDAVHKVRVVHEVTKLVLNARSASNNEMFTVVESADEIFLCSCFVSEMLAKLVVIVQNATGNVQEVRRLYKVTLSTRDGYEVLSRASRISSSSMEETCGSGSFVALDLVQVQKLIDTKGDLGLVLKVNILKDTDSEDSVAINIADLPSTL